MKKSPRRKSLSSAATTKSSASKLGAHVLRMNDDTAKFIAAGPGVVKFAGDWGYAANVPAGTFILGRRILQTNDDAQQIRARGMTPAEGVQDFIYGREHQIDIYRANPAIQYWEGHNEPIWGDLDGMKWYADFEINRMQEMAKIGLKCVIGNFATGTPALELWPGFMDALQAAKQYGAVLGLHEYSCPWIWWMTGRYQMQPENRVDPSNPDRLEGWTTLRYRQVYRQFLQPAGLGDLPLVITEFGIDGLVNPKPDDAPSATWRGQRGYWSKHKNDTDLDYVRQKYPIPPDVAPMTGPEQFYVEQLKWYDRQIRQDPFVIGATIFTFGSFGGAWADFDVTGSQVAPLLTAYVQQDAAPSPPPPPPPPPPALPIMIVQPAVTPHGGLKVRAARSVDAPYVEALPAGAQVAVLEGPVQDNGETWLRVRTANGNEGWVRPFGDGEVYLKPNR